MPVFLELLDLDEAFHTLSEEPTILNDIPNVSEDDRSRVASLIQTQYTSDMISLLPRCECGHLKGERVLREICERCRTPVTSLIQSNVEPNVWFRTPEGVGTPDNPKALINPEILIMLDDRFKRSGFSVIQWLMDRTYKSPVKTPPVVTELLQLGVTRGYNYFVQNFDYLMDILFSRKDFRVKKNETDWLRILLDSVRGSIFSEYMPLPNKSLLIIEKTNVGIYIDNIFLDIKNVINMMTSIDKNFYDQNPTVKENRCAKALIKFTEFLRKLYKVNLSPKQGQYRRHAYGSRTNFSFRAVISSLTDTHAYDEIHVPWGVGLTAFRPHVINKLKRRGFSNNTALGLVMAHVEKYHPLLDEILEELIAETRDGRIHCILQRNPSLLQGSAQRVGITKFKKDPMDHTISISILIVKAPNADFDGDQMNVTIALDNKSADMWYPLAPQFNIFQLTSPFKVSGNIALPKPVTSTISNWLEHDPDFDELMEELRSTQPVEAAQPRFVPGNINSWLENDADQDMLKEAMEA